MPFTVISQLYLLSAYATYIMELMADKAEAGLGGFVLSWTITAGGLLPVAATIARASVT